MPDEEQELRNPEWGRRPDTLSVAQVSVAVATPRYTGCRPYLLWRTARMTYCGQTAARTVVCRYRLKEKAAYLQGF